MYDHFTRQEATRRPCNSAEGSLYDQAFQKGWKVTKRGWPDFFCINKAGRVMMVECKPRNHHGGIQRLMREQTLVFEFFVSKGIDCFVSDGETMERYDRQRHANMGLLRKLNLADGAD